MNLGAQWNKYVWLNLTSLAYSLVSFTLTIYLIHFLTTSLVADAVITFDRWVKLAVHAARRAEIGHASEANVIPHTSLMTDINEVTPQSIKCLWKCCNINWLFLIFQSAPCVQIYLLFGSVTLRESNLGARLQQLISMIQSPGKLAIYQQKILALKHASTSIFRTSIRPAPTFHHIMVYKYRSEVLSNKTAPIQTDDKYSRFCMQSLNDHELFLCFKSSEWQLML